MWNRSQTTKNSLSRPLVSGGIFDDRDEIDDIEGVSEGTF